MKKLTIALILIPALLLGACGNNASKKKEAATTKAEPSLQEQYLTEDLIVKMNDLIAAFQEMGAMPHVQALIDGKVALTEQDKRVKPTFLYNPSKVSELVTLSQKNRALGVMLMDRSYAQMYEMPTDEYDAAIAKLAVETDNQTILEGGEIDVEVNSYDTNTWIAKVGNEQLSKEQINVFLELGAAAMLENLYFMSLDVPRYIAFFDDKTASEVSYRFLLVVDAIESVLPYHPELATVNEIIQPLKVINAINVEQLEKQLNELGETIAAARAKMIE